MRRGMGSLSNVKLLVVLLRQVWETLLGVDECAVLVVERWGVRIWRKQRGEGLREEREKGWDALLPGSLLSQIILRGTLDPSLQSTFSISMRDRICCDAGGTDGGDML